MIAVDYGGYAGYLNVWAKAIENNPDLNVHILSYEGLKKVNTDTRTCPTLSLNMSARMFVYVQACVHACV